MRLKSLKKVKPTARFFNLELTPELFNALSHVASETGLSKQELISAFIEIGIECDLKHVVTKHALEKV